VGLLGGSSGLAMFPRRLPVSVAKERVDVMICASLSLAELDPPIVGSRRHAICRAIVEPGAGLLDVAQDGTLKN
jgi:hypothetical protein